MCRDSSRRQKPGCSRPETAQPAPGQIDRHTADGVDPADVFHAYVAALVAMVVFGIPAAIKQQNYSPIIKDAHAHTHVDWVRIGIVALQHGPFR